MKYSGRSSSEEGPADMLEHTGSSTPQWAHAIEDTGTDSEKPLLADLSPEEAPRPASAGPTHLLQFTVDMGHGVPACKFLLCWHRWSQQQRASCTLPCTVELPSCTLVHDGRRPSRTSGNKMCGQLAHSWPVCKNKHKHIPVSYYVQLMTLHSCSKFSKMSCSHSMTSLVCERV